MRRLFVAAAAALSIAGASLLAAAPAQALPGAAGLGTAADSGLVQNVRTVCRPVWNGFAWVQSCYWVPGPAYYGPGPGYYGGPRYYGRPYYGPRYRAYRRW